MTTIFSTLRHLERQYHGVNQYARLLAAASNHLSDPLLLAMDQTASLHQAIEQSPAWMFREGSLRGDLLAGRFGDEEALERLAERIAPNWRLFGQERGKLHARARDDSMSTPSMKRLLLVKGVALALSTWSEEQAMRFGRQNVVDDRGRRALLAPRDIRMRYIWRWLSAVAIRAARSDLLEQPFSPLETGREPETEHDVYDRRVPVVNDVTKKTEYRPVPPVTLNREGSPDPIDSSTDPLAILLVDEQWQEAARRLGGLLVQVPPGRAMQEMLPYILEQLQADSKLDFAAIDRILDLKPGTARQRFFQYRQRIRKAI